MSKDYSKNMAKFKRYMKQNRQIYKFLANIYTQEYNPLNFL